MNKITNDQLLALANEFRNLNPDNWFVPSDLDKGTIGVYTNKRFVPESRIVLFSAAPDGKVRVTKVLGARKSLLEEAGVKTERFVALAEPNLDSIRKVYEPLRLKYNAAVAKVKVVLDQKEAESKAYEQFENQARTELGAYSFGRFFRLNGAKLFQGKVRAKDDHTVTLKLDRLTLDQAKQILDMLGTPTEYPPVALKAILDNHSLSQEDWDKLTPEEQAKLQTEMADYLYGTKF